MTDHIKTLPASIQRLADWVGHDAALVLVSHFGGATTPYIPSPDRLTEQHWLVELVGMEPARTIAFNLGGGTLHLPKCTAALRATRNQMILDAYYRERKTQRELALLYKLDERQIRSIVNGQSMAKKTEQTDLFNFNECQNDKCDTNGIPCESLCRH